MEVNNGNKSDSMKKIEKQLNPRVTFYHHKFNTFGLLYFSIFSIYKYIVIYRQTVSLYQNSSV